MLSFWSRFILCLMIVSSCSRLHHAKPTLDEYSTERRNANNENVDYNNERGAAKRPLDNAVGQSSMTDFSKRRFDRIEGYTSLGGLQKRVFDQIGYMSSLGGLDKKSSSAVLEGREIRLLPNRLRKQMHRAFDSIGGSTDLGGLNR